MSIEQKAIDLHVKFLKVIQSEDRQEEIELSRDAAIICVDELIAQCEIDSDQKYWYDVKNVLLNIAD